MSDMVGRGSGATQSRAPLRATTASVRCEPRILAGHLHALDCETAFGDIVLRSIAVTGARVREPFEHQLRLTAARSCACVDAQPRNEDERTLAVHERAVALPRAEARRLVLLL